MANGEPKTIDDLVKDLAGMKIDVVYNKTLYLYSATGLKLDNAKQGACVFSCTNGHKYPRLYFEKYGVNIKLWKNNIYFIVPTLT